MEEASPKRRFALNLATVGILLALVLAMADIPSAIVSPHDRIATSDNDSITRFVSVRDWLAGQSWYDMSLHRVSPPDGVSLHWSRYVDLGLATIIWPVSQVLPMKTAEAAAIVIWPALLQVLMIILSGTAAARLFGPLAGGVAALAVVFWPVTGSVYFGQGRLDHHNIQILLLLVVILSMIGAGDALRRGLIGGSAAALSLAIGLENLLPLGVAGLILYARLWRDPASAGLQPSIYAVAMFLGGAVLFAGQTPPTQWFIAYCDELAPPVLALTGIAALVTVAATLLARGAAGTWRNSVIFGGLALAGAIAAFPLISFCASGPYGALPDEMQEIIATRILEARPAYMFLQKSPAVFFTGVFPALFTVLVSTAIWMRARRTTGAAAATHKAVGVLLVFGWIGLAGSFVQLRLLVLSASVVPVLMGYVLSTMFTARQAPGASPLASLNVIAMGAMTLFFPALYKFVLGVAASLQAQSEVATAPLTPASCRTPQILQTLDVLPPSRILSYLNYGPPILLMTEHSVLAAPYHRSASALGNGILPFEMDRDGLLSVIDGGGAEYLVLCRETGVVGAGFYASELAHGAVDTRLVAVDGVHEGLVVLKVQR